MYRIIDDIKGVIREIFRHSTSDLHRNTEAVFVGYEERVQNIEYEQK